MIVSILIIARETVDGVAVSSIKRGDNNIDSHYLQQNLKACFFSLYKRESAAKWAKESAAESHR